MWDTILTRPERHPIVVSRDKLKSNKNKISLKVTFIFLNVCLSWILIRGHSIDISEPCVEDNWEALGHRVIPVDRFVPPVCYRDHGRLEMRPQLWEDLRSPRSRAHNNLDVVN